MPSVKSHEDKKHKFFQRWLQIPSFKLIILTGYLVAYNETYSEVIKVSPRSPKSSSSFHFHSCDAPFHDATITRDG